MFPLEKTISAIKSPDQWPGDSFALTGKYLLFQFGPITSFAQLAPLLVLVFLDAVIVAVRSLLYGQVIPCGSIGVVAPLDHVVVQVLCSLRKALEDAVYERHRLGTGDLVIRTEGAVGITVDPTVVGSGADFILCPVGCNVTEVNSGRVGLVVKTSCDRSELRTGDRRIRIELAVAVALYDAHSAQRRNSVVVPCAGCYVGVAVGLGGVCIAGLIGEQTEEDGCYLSTGNAVLRTNGAVRIAYDVSIVVIAVQTGRYIIRNGNGGLAAAAATTAGRRSSCVGVGEYGVLLNLCITDRSRIPGTSTVAGVRLVTNVRDRGDRNHNVFERFAGFIVLERNVNNDVSVAAVVPLAVYNLECKAILPCVRGAIAGLVRLLTALDVKVVVQVDGNVLGQLFKVIGNLGQTRNVNVGLAVNGLVYCIILVKLSNQCILIAGLGLTVLYLNLNVLLVVEVLVDGVRVLVLGKETFDGYVALDFKILCIFVTNLPARERMSFLLQYICLGKVAASYEPRHLVA